MKPLTVLSFVPLITLAMAFDLVCALSILGWIILARRDTTVTNDVLGLLRDTLRGAS